MTINPEINEQKINQNLHEAIIKYQQIFGGKNNMEPKYLPTGNEALNVILNGGYKKGTLTEISGVTDSGKTLLALKAIKEAEKQGKISIYIDAASKLTTGMLEDNNIDKDKVLILYMNAADTMGPILSEIIKACIDDIGVIVIDNLANLTTSKEQIAPLNANTDIHRSKVIKSLLTRMSNLVRNTDACVLIVNQERSNIVDNEIQGTISSSEKWINICCDTRVKLTIDEDGDSCVEVAFKERKL